MPGGSALAHRPKYMMLIATAARMGVGLISFVLMARYLGPEQFGLLAAAIAFSAVAATLSDFGLGISSLRLMAASPAETGVLVRRMMAAKIVLAGALALVYAGGVLALVASSKWPLFMFALVGQVGFSVADLSMVPLRVHNRFGTEALITVGASIAMLGLLAVVVILSRDGTATAAAFAAGRSLYAVAALTCMARTLNIRPIGLVARRDIAVTLRDSRGFAVDGSLTSLSTQIDVPLFGLALTAAQLGIYQAGGRLVQVIIPFTAVLGNVYLPTLASLHAGSDAPAFAARARELVREMVLLAMIVGTGFAMLGPPLGRILYPAPYEPLVVLWAGFGIHAMFRLTAVGFGLPLAAAGLVNWRIVGHVTSMAMLVLAALLLAIGVDAAWTSMMLAASSLVLLLLLAGANMQQGWNRRSNALALVAVLSAGAALSMTGGLWR